MVKSIMSPYIYMPIIASGFLYRYLRSRYKTDVLTRRPLYGQVILITEANSDIGEATARLLYLSGCRLILSSQNMDNLKKVKENLMLQKFEEEVFEPFLLCIDLEDLDSIDKKVESAHTYHGRIDLLINIAGMDYYGDISNTSMETYYKVMKNNYLAPVALTKAVLPYMIKQQGGTIVMISSSLSLFSIPNQSALLAAKISLQVFSDSLRCEMKNSKINICNVNPSKVKSKCNDAVIPEGMEDEVRTRNEASETGINPHCVAYKILEGAVFGNKEVNLPFYSSMTMALRILFPSMFFYLQSRGRQQLRS